MNGVTDVMIALVDVLDVFDEIRMCTAYQFADHQLHHVPALLDDLVGAEPVWQSLPGWNQDTTSARTWDDLPEAARSYLDAIETTIGAPVNFAGVGPDREQTIERKR